MRKINWLTVTFAITSAILVKASDDVVVPVPPALKLYGKLEVVGLAGSGQDKTFDIKRCQSSAEGVPAKFGCATLKSANLNEVVTLAPGLYRIEYSNMVSRPIRVTENQTSYLALKKVVVPKVDSTYTFKVFRDLTNKAEQDRFVKETWSDADNQKYFNYCTEVINKDNALCLGWIKNDLKTYRNAYYFQDDGAFGVYQLNSGSLSDIDRVFVVDPKDGDFVAVFPGVYGVTFTNREGVTQDIYGIEVK